MTGLLVTDAQAHPPMAGLGHWLVSSKLEGRPVADTGLYPCRCDDVDDDPPQWLVDVAREQGRRRDQIPKCRPYLAKKGKRVGRWWSYCDCWGRRRDEQLPDTCCAWHEHNPAYAVTGVLGIELAARQPTTVYAASGLPEPDDGHDPDERILLGLWASGNEPYVRRWTHAELHCACSTPWDGVTDARKVGYHCPACHSNFTNWARAQAHQKFVTVPCKNPATQRDIDGRPVYRGQLVGNGMIVYA